MDTDKGELVKLTVQQNNIQLHSIIYPFNMQTQIDDIFRQKKIKHRMFEIKGRKGLLIMCW